MYFFSLLILTVPEEALNFEFQIFKRKFIYFVLRNLHAISGGDEFWEEFAFPPHAAFSFAIKSSGNWILKSDALLLWNYLGDKPNHFHKS